MLLSVPIVIFLKCQTATTAMCFNQSHILKPELSISFSALMTDGGGDIHFSNRYFVRSSGKVGFFVSIFSNS